jgi:hypothetical protein
VTRYVYPLLGFSRGSPVCRFLVALVPFTLVSGSCKISGPRTARGGMVTEALRGDFGLDVTCENAARNKTKNVNFFITRS